MKELAHRIEQSTAALSTRVVAEMYEDRFWLARFGQRGREHSERDGRFHISYLVQALLASDSTLLTRYARWLRSVLTTRGMCSRHLAENFERLAHAIQDQLPDSAAAQDYLRAASAALVDDDGPARELHLASEQLVAQVCMQLEPAASFDARGPDRELSHLLSYLVDALSLGRTEHLLAHVRWLSGFLEREGPRSGQLAVWLDALASCVARSESLSPELRAAAGNGLQQARAELARGSTLGGGAAPP